MNTHGLDRLVVYHFPAANVDDLGTLPDRFLHAIGASDPKDPASQVVIVAYLLAARRDHGAHLVTMNKATRHRGAANASSFSGDEEGQRWTAHH